MSLQNLNLNNLFLPAHKCKKYLKLFLKLVILVIRLSMKGFLARKSKPITKNFHLMLLILTEEFQVILNNLTTTISNPQNIKTKKVKKSSLHKPKLESTAHISSVLSSNFIQILLNLNGKSALGPIF